MTARLPKPLKSIRCSFPGRFPAYDCSIQPDAIEARIELLHCNECFDAGRQRGRIS